MSAVSALTLLKACSLSTFERNFERKIVSPNNAKVLIETINLEDFIILTIPSKDLIPLAALKRNFLIIPDNASANINPERIIVRQTTKSGPTFSPLSTKSSIPIVNKANKSLPKLTSALFAPRRKAFTPVITQSFKVFPDLSNEEIPKLSLKNVSTSNKTMIAIISAIKVIPKPMLLGSS